MVLLCAGFFFCMCKKGLWQYKICKRLGIQPTKPIGKSGTVKQVGPNVCVISHIMGTMRGVNQECLNLWAERVAPLGDNSLFVKLFT